MTPALTPTPAPAPTAADPRPLVFLDLDDTLFQTRRKNATAPHVAAVDRAGQPLSFMTDAQAMLAAWLSVAARVVPTTGRNSEALSRVGLDFSNGAICSFGGLIRRADGTPDPEWQALMATHSADHAEALHTLDALLGIYLEMQSLDIRHRVITDAGLDLYLSAKHNAAAWEELEAVADWLRAEVPAGWRVHLNGNNLAVLPPFLDKAHAVRWFRNRIAGPHPFAIGLGDSLSDVEFLLACDIAALPAGAQLAQRLAGG